MPRFLMRILFVFLVLLLVGCAGTRTMPEQALKSMGAEVIEVEASLTAPSKSEIVAVEEVIDPCLECHSDRQTLIDTAKPFVLQLVGCAGTRSMPEQALKSMGTENIRIRSVAYSTIEI